MIRRYCLLSAAVVMASVLSACGNLTQSPAHDLTFQAPAGFESRASIMGMMQVWSADGGKQDLMLFRMPTGVDPHSVVKSANFKDAKILKQESITICKGEPATYLMLAGDKTKTAALPAQHEIVQMVMLRASANTIFSMYAYPQGTSPNPAAVSALRQLCTKPGTTA